MFRLFRAAVICLTIGLFYGCASFDGARLPPSDSLKVPPHNEIGNIPFFPQTDYQCGPAVLAMGLAWSGVRTTPDTVAPEVFTPSLKGSLQSAMVGAGRRNARVAYPISGMTALIKELAAGHPVIVLQNLGLSWAPVWHYSLAVGYDLHDRIIILHSGKTARKQLSLDVFRRTWARSDYWGLLILPPDMMPATAQEDVYIAAVIGLERARRWNEALAAYVTALNTWPSSYAAHLGMGNCYYALGDLNGAETVYRGMVFRFPEKGAAYNNLAQVLAEQHKYPEALAAIRSAIRIDGAFADEYRKTLDEIKAKMKTGDY